MKKFKNLIFVGGVIGVVLFIVVALSAPGEPSKFSGMEATVYMSPTCGCCGNYVAYLTRKGIKVKTVKTNEMQSIKDEMNIPEYLRACHTTVIADYIVEGHIPIEGIDKLLSEKPSIRGIALPGMPAASPGMPGEKTIPFDIYKLQDGEKDELFLSI